MDGIIVLNKPEGMTSFDVIARLRKKTGQKKFGHTGTLDPQASGVLVVLAGKAARLLQFLSDTDKEYIASIELGVRTDTDDVFGEVLERREPNRDFDFDQVLQTFKGKQHQKVPAASAKKVDGKKLYDYLRQGKEVPDVYSDVEIYNLEVLDEDELKFKVDCSGGTYIRSICRDFGEKTGNLAAMKSLIRTKANGFDISQAQNLDEELKVWPLETVLDFEKIQAENPADIKNGKPVNLDIEGDLVLLKDGDAPLAVYKRQTPGQKRFVCARGIWS